MTQNPKIKKEEETMASNIYIVDGRSLTEEEFQKLLQDKTIKLKLIEGTSNQYKTLKKLEG